MKKLIIYLLLVPALCGCQNRTADIPSPDTIQFPIGYPDTTRPVIEQLLHYPLPRYLPGNKLLRLFNWLDPNYMAGRGHKSTPAKLLPLKAVEIQSELADNWNYGIVIPNSADDRIGAIIKLANAKPDVDLHVITFWMAVKPKLIGYTNTQGSFITSKKLDTSVYINFRFNGKPKREVKFNFPDSLARIDGLTQKFYLEKIVSKLTRPINFINENGEEPPGPYLFSKIRTDAAMIHMKDSMKIKTWEKFMATRKMQLRDAYSSAFMKEIPELKDTKFNFYATDAGPIDRFDWNFMKKCMTPIDGRYYSTPDFYPRWPRNWRDWSGPWHGWKWIESGRRLEIKNGDYLFSPFVSPGWSKKQEEDIRPGPWLGLLKCLGVIGAEFYYTGYFSLSAPFTDPGKWAWQAAMPAYAQAVTSRYEDVLKEGNVLFNGKEPVITYTTSDKHVLVTIRKHNTKDRYVICGTYQPYTYNHLEIPEKKVVTVEFNNEKLTFEIRRQGSVYVYEKTGDKVLFYQLDAWHENAHPDHWSHDFMFEAEVSDTALSNKVLFTENTRPGDYSDYTSYVTFSGSTAGLYKFTERDSSHALKYICVRYRGEGTVSFDIRSAQRTIAQKSKLNKTDQWKWETIVLPEAPVNSINQDLLIKCVKGSVGIDKLYITSDPSAVK